MKKLLTVFMAICLVSSFGLFAFAEEVVEDDFVESGTAVESQGSIEDFASIFETFSSDDSGSFDVASLLGGNAGGISDILSGMTGGDSSSGEITGVLSQVMGGVDSGELMDTLGQSFSSMTGGISEAMGMMSPDQADDVMAGLFSSLSGAGVDTNALTTALGDSPVFNLFAGLYTGAFTAKPKPTAKPTAAPTVAPTQAPTNPPAPETTKAPVTGTTSTDIPKTGSTTSGIALFAVLSVAAAAAFVARKKEA